MPCERCDGEGVISHPSGIKLANLKGKPPSQDLWARRQCPECGDGVESVAPITVPQSEKKTVKKKSKVRRILGG